MVHVCVLNCSDGGSSVQNSLCLRNGKPGIETQLLLSCLNLNKSLHFSELNLSTAKGKKQTSHTIARNSCDKPSGDTL
jgi:hypothetical protein